MQITPTIVSLIESLNLFRNHCQFIMHCQLEYFKIKNKNLQVIKDIYNDKQTDIVSGILELFRNGAHREERQKFLLAFVFILLFLCFHSKNLVAEKNNIYFKRSSE